jgi:hypothetical protein
MKRKGTWSTEMESEKSRVDDTGDFLLANAGGVSTKVIT